MYREVLASYELSADELVEAIDEGAGIVLALELEPRARVVGSDDVETLASGVSEEGDVPEVHGPRIGAYQAPSINLDPVAVQANLARLGGRRDEDRLLFHISHPGFHGSAAASLTRAITGQNATAPKLMDELSCASMRLITSQNATAPKPMEQVSPCKENGHPAGKHLSPLKKVLVNNHFILECIGIHVGIIFQHEHA